MTKIVQPRRRVSVKAAVQAEAAEEAMHPVTARPPVPAGHEKRCARLTSRIVGTVVQPSVYGLLGGRAHRHKTLFAELALSHKKRCIGEINISEVESQGLPDAQTRGVE